MLLLSVFQSLNLLPRYYDTLNTFSAVNKKACCNQKLETHTQTTQTQLLTNKEERMKLVLAVIMLISLSYCAQGEYYNCYPGIKLEMYFGLGLNVGNTTGVSAQITNDAWNKFVDDVITPRFPDGLSVVDISNGQWLSTTTGTIEKEKSKLLILLMADTHENLRKVKEISEIYCQQFLQESVLINKVPSEAYCFEGKGYY